MYRTVTLLMEKINISSLDFYFGELTRTFHFAKNLRIKPSAAPRGLEAFRHHLKLIIRIKRRGYRMFRFGEELLSRLNYV